jgi:hypothetical protein
MATDQFDSPGKRTGTLLPPHKTLPPPEQETRPSKLRFNDGNHTYYDGKKWMPSVTGITKRGGEDESGLFSYYAGKAAECAIEEAAEVSRLRRLEGDDVAHEYIKRAADRHRDKAAVKGSDLHDVVDRMQSGREVPEYLHDDILAMAKQVIAFLDDYQVEALYSELRLVHRTMGYFGTTDTVGIVPQYGDVPILIDWKTSESMYREPKYSNGKNSMQLAAYSRAEVMFWDDKTEADMTKVNQDVGLIVMVRPEGYKVYDYDIYRAWPQFERALASYWWWREDKSLARPVRPKVAAAVAAVEAPVRDPLLDQIAEVLDPATFDELWENNESVWTDEHTAEVRKRLAQLEAAS